MKLCDLIKLDHVSKYYVLGNHKVCALKNINFKLNRGELTAIMGASGSGKSTLMNIIGFLDRPSSGEYYFNESNVSSLDDGALANIRNKKIGFVFQSFFLLPRLNALQNTMLPLFYRGLTHQTSKEKAMYMLDKVNVSHVVRHLPSQLSGGQQQRVAIARALVSDPEIILADEPTGALDSQTGSEIMDLLIKLNKEENRTIMIITHDQAVSQQCHRIVTIKDGIIID